MMYIAEILSIIFAIMSLILDDVSYACLFLLWAILFHLYDDKNRKD